MSDDDREGDPFDRLGNGDDRDGDPFDRLDDTDDEPSEGRAVESGADDASEEPPGAAGDGADWFDDSVPESDTLADGAGTDRDPFPGTDDREGDPFEDAESAFERMEVGDLDADSVWETLDEARIRGSVTERQGRTYAEVSKHRFCEQCEYFSEPPEIACAHEGTEIVEFLDMETVRVVDCPVVAERRELEDQE